jgi:hypothetical protein
MLLKFEIYRVFDVQYSIPNLFIESLSNIVCFVKVRVRVMVMMFNGAVMVMIVC